MNMNAKRLLIALCITVLVTLPTQSNAGSVRGQVVGRNPYSPASYPLPGASVDIYAMGPNGWQLVYRFITGPDGMYYIPNLLPGNYTIQVNGRMNFPLFVGNVPSQDVPPILITY